MSNKFYELFGGSIYQSVSGKLGFSVVHRKLLALIPKNEHLQILDVGCGTGKMLSRMAETFPNAELSGVDLSTSMIDFAKKKYPNLSFTVGNAENLPLKKEVFDVVTNSISFHHYHHPQKAVNEAYRVLKLGGQFFLVDISPKKPKVLDFLTTHFVRDGHVGFITPSKMRSMFENAGFKNIAQHKTGIPTIWITVGEKI